MGSYWVRVSPKPSITSDSGEKFGHRGDPQGKRGCVRTEAEMGVRQPQARGCWQHQKPGEGVDRLSLGGPGGLGPAGTLVLHFWPPEPGEINLWL